MTITIRATNMEMTETIRAYAEEKFMSLEKFFDNIQTIDIDMGVNSNHHQKGNIFYTVANVTIPGKLLRVERDSEDLYKSIGKVKDHLRVELHDMKEKMLHHDRDSVRDNKTYTV